MGNSSSTKTLQPGTLFGGYPGIVLQQKIALVADDTDGSFPDTNITAEDFGVSKLGGNLVGAYVKPGTIIVPTTAFGVTVEMDGIDLLGGAGADIDSSADKLITPLVGAVYAPAVFVGDLVVKVAGNVVNAATMDIYLLFQ